MNRIVRALTNPSVVFKRVYNSLMWILPDELFLKIKYREMMGRKLNLTNPQTFSEKLQWLKLYNRRPEFTTMVDKYAVKEYVAGIIGEEYIIPTLAVWNRVEDIEWDKLPNQFVLKCTHNSNGLVICRDKSNLDKEEATRKLRLGLRQNYYRKTREWPYKNVPRKIIAEKYVEPDPDMNDLPDYKFFCFNGEPKYCQVITGRETNMCIDFFDKNWNHQSFHEPKMYPFSNHQLEKPSKYEKMCGLASKLAKNKAFCRLDFYEVRGSVFFGEITFFPTSGMGGFDPEKWDYIFGNWIILPPKDRR